MFHKIYSTVFKNKIIKGTFILTIAGFCTRLIGFLFRIFLTGKIGAEGLGIYQLIFPIQIICYSICAAGFETALSKLTAEAVGKHKDSSVYLKICICTSLIISCVVSAIIYNFSGFISNRIILEKRCNSLIKILALSIPCSSIHACINGYFFGMRRTKIPAVSQIVEQLMRVISIILFIVYLEHNSLAVTPAVAVVGTVAGEISSMLYCVFNIRKTLFTKKQPIKSLIAPQKPVPDNLHNSASATTLNRNLLYQNIRNIFSLSLPISLNRLMVSILQSIESVLIPNMLILYGLSSKKALGTYGILMGLVIPLILFPGSVINSLALLLLPTISEADSNHNTSKISKTINHSLAICCIFGIFCSAVFICYGHDIGHILFSSQEAGNYISSLGYLCPFIYISVTLSSIINGMGHTSVTFAFNIITTILQIAVIVFIIPRYGISGFIIGFIVSNALNSILLFLYMRHNISTSINVFSMIIYPILTLFVLIECIQFVFLWIPFIHPFVRMILSIILLIIGYIYIMRKELEELINSI